MQEWRPNLFLKTIPDRLFRSVPRFVFSSSSILAVSLSRYPLKNVAVTLCRIFVHSWQLPFSGGTGVN